MLLLMAKGLPTLWSNGLTKCTWNLEYVDMVEFLPAPRSLRIIHKAREANSIPTGQFGGGSWPIPSTTAAPKESVSRAGCQHVDEFFTLYVVMMARRWTGAQHGCPPALCAHAPPEGSDVCGLAGLRYPCSLGWRLRQLRT